MDTMIGGDGNDTYVVDNIADVVTESNSSLTQLDTVEAGFSYTLGANVENLLLTGGGVINGTGNSLNNSLIGNSGANILNGGLGADTMIGGQGNDTYLVDNLGDVVTENAAEGTDLVQSSVSFTLGADIENLTLTGSAAINGTGNDLDNILLGNSGTNILDGGTGADTMTGGLGNDTYVWTTLVISLLRMPLRERISFNQSINYTLGAQCRESDLNRFCRHRRYRQCSE